MHPAKGNLFQKEAGLLDRQTLPSMLKEATTGWGKLKDRNVTDCHWSRQACRATPGVNHTICNVVTGPEQEATLDPWS